MIYALGMQRLIFGFFNASQKERIHLKIYFFADVSVFDLLLFLFFDCACVCFFLY